jgi:hypothetical protein
MVEGLRGIQVIQTATVVHNPKPAIPNLRRGWGRYSASGGLSSWFGKLAISCDNVVH